MIIGLELSEAMIVNKAVLRFILIFSIVRKIKYTS